MYSQSDMKSQLKDINHKELIIQSKEQENKKNRILLAIFVGCLFIFGVLVYNRPAFSSHKQIYQEITFPPTVKHIQRLSYALIEYKNQHPIYFFVTFVYLYTLLRTFSIPGAIFLCILSPTLYGGVGGFFISLSCSCLGSSLCYFLSYTLARSLVLRKFPDLFKKFNGMVNAHRHNLFGYMMFLRLTPFIPGWFVNLASPLVGIPPICFIVATFFGLMPRNFIMARVGLTLQQIQTFGIGTQNFITSLILGCLSLIFTFFSNKYKNVQEYQKVQSQ